MKKNKIILGLVGLMSSGKGTIAEYLKKNRSATTYRFSTIIRDVLDILHLPHSRKNMQCMSTVLRQNFGEDVFAKVIAEKVKNDKKKIIAVDGIRRLADIRYLKELDNFILTRVVADPKVRYQRLIQRLENQGDAQKTYEEFLADHNKEADAEIPMIMNQATEQIDNNGNFDALHQQIEKILRKFNG